MQSYVESSSESPNQPLDFTSKSEAVDMPILDLSCKKPEQQQEQRQQQMNQSNSYSLSSMSLEMGSLSSSCESTTSNSHHPYQSQQVSYSDGQKSPLEVRTFMVTPPSESDSPKKQKFHSIYPKLNLSGVDISSKYCQRLSMNMSYPMSPVLSNLLTSDNISSIHVPGPVTTVTPTTTTSTPSNHNNISTPLISPEVSKKGPRPFKAYPKDPLSMSVGPAEIVHDPTSNEAYNEFRKRMLESVRKTNEGTNIKMRRVSKSPTLPTSTMDDKDAAYWERRRKNNEAAKRSRDARRAKEDEIAIRAAFLEQENMQLKCELVALRNETAKLRCMIFSN